MDDRADARIVSAVWTELGLRLTLKLLSDDSEWHISCAGASAWRLEDQFTAGLHLTEDDPLLWHLQFDVRRTYFKGQPANCYQAACEVLSAVPAYANLLSSTPMGLAELLRAGNGCLGDLPKPAFDLCESTLQAHGVLVYYAEPGRKQTEAKPAMVLFFGDSSFIVAEQFHAEPATTEEADADHLLQVM